ncbi:MAG TPA: hypothetical protein VMB52_07115 [Verrucomicrobiae bacterium]|nr:hypothetical protein [Verrucomicrobiae bacterium]
MKFRPAIAIVILTVSVLAPLLPVLPKSIVQAAGNCPQTEQFTVESPPSGSTYSRVYLLKSSGGCVPNGCPGNGNALNVPSLPTADTGESAPILLQIQCPQTPDSTADWTCPSVYSIGIVSTDVQCIFINNNNAVVSGGNSYNGCADVSGCDLITNYLDPAIAFLAALVGVAVTASIIIGGIQYSSAGGDPSKVTAARTRIRNALLALFVFIFLYALLDFLIPGGL